MVAEPLCALLYVVSETDVGRYVAHKVKFNNFLEWRAVLSRRTPMLLVSPTIPTVALGNVASWLAARIPFECRYELADVLSNGEPCFGCVYELEGSYTKYMLISDTGEQEQLSPIVLFGWDDLQAHHQRFGDGRAIVLEDESAIVEPSFCVQAVALSQLGSLKAETTY